MAFMTSNNNASNTSSSSSHTKNLDDYHACIKEIEQETSGQHNITNSCMQQMAIKRMAEKRMNAKKNSNSTTGEKKNVEDKTNEKNNGNRISLNIHEQFKRGTAQLKNILNMDDNDNDNVNNTATTNNAFSSNYQKQQGRPEKLITRLSGINPQQQQQQQYQNTPQQQPCIMRRGSDADPMGRIDPKQLQMLRDMAASYSSLENSLNGDDNNNNDDDNSNSTSSSMLSAAIERAFQQKAGLSFSSIADALEEIAGQNKNHPKITDFPNVNLSNHAFSPKDTSPVNTPQGGQQSPTTSSQQQQQPPRKRSQQKKRLSLTKQFEKSINLSNIHELEELHLEDLSVSLHHSSQYLAYDAEADESEASESSSLDYNDGSLICRWKHEKDNDDSIELSVSDLKKTAGPPSDKEDGSAAEEEEEEKVDDMNDNDNHVPHEVNLGRNSNDDHSNSSASSWKDGNESTSTLICKFGPRPTRRVSDISMGDIHEAALSE